MSIEELTGRALDAEVERRLSGCEVLFVPPASLIREDDAYVATGPPEYVVQVTERQALDYAPQRERLYLVDGGGRRCAAVHPYSEDIGVAWTALERVREVG